MRDKTITLVPESTEPLLGPDRDHCDREPRQGLGGSFGSDGIKYSECLANRRTLKVPRVRADDDFEEGENVH